MLIVTPNHTTDTDEVDHHLADAEAHAGHHLTGKELDEEFEHFISTPA